jgi:extradiol dioxygenase family protein
MDALFHLAFPVTDIEESRKFYGQVLGCEEGRSADRWVDFNLFGHQIVAHLVSNHVARASSNPVDEKDVPIPHFGAILTMTEFEELADRVRAAGVKFIIEPYVRFRGEIGEQATMFFLDPSGNALEFKAFADRSRIFAK